MMADDRTGHAIGPDAIRPHVEAVLAQSTARADWRVTPTAYADGYTYTVEISAFVSRADLERAWPKRYVVGHGQFVDLDDSHVVIRSVN